MAASSLYREIFHFMVVFSRVIWCTGAEVAQKSRLRSRLTISVRKYHAVNSWIGIRLLLVERDVLSKIHFDE